MFGFFVNKCFGKFGFFVLGLVNGREGEEWDNILGEFSLKLEFK